MHGTKEIIQEANALPVEERVLVNDREHKGIFIF